MLDLFTWLPFGCLVPRLLELVPMFRGFIGEPKGVTRPFGGGTLKKTQPQERVLKLCGLGLLSLEGS